MTDIEQRARAALNEAHGGIVWLPHDTREIHPTIEAMCREIEAHDATKAELADFKREVSDAVKFDIANYDGLTFPRLSRFIQPDPVKVDPLVEAFEECAGRVDLRYGETQNQFRARCIREALAKRNLTITEGDAK